MKALDVYPDDLSKLPLLRLFRVHLWPTWLEAAGAKEIMPCRALLDVSPIMAQAAMLGEGWRWR